MHAPQGARFRPTISRGDVEPLSRCRRVSALATRSRQSLRRGARVRWCPRTLVPENVGARVRWCPSPLVPESVGARERWCPSRNLHAENGLMLARLIVKTGPTVSQD
jgi:hypothetical protein